MLSVSVVTVLPGILWSYVLLHVLASQFSSEQKLVMTLCAILIYACSEILEMHAFSFQGQFLDYSGTPLDFSP
jgi:hypothetical protein